MDFVPIILDKQLQARAQGACSPQIGLLLDPRWLFHLCLPHSYARIVSRDAFKFGLLTVR